MIFAASALALLGFGLTMLASVSAVESFRNFGNTYGYVQRQLLQGLVIGIVGFSVAFKINYQKLKPLSVWFLIFSVGLLVLVHFNIFTFSAGGAARWLRFGPVFFQPSELAKVALVIYSASLLSRSTVLNAKQLAQKTLPVLIATLVVFGFIIAQPDLGSGLIVLIVGLVMLFLGETSLKHLLWLGVFGTVSILLLIKFEPYRLQRMLVFLKPSSDPQGIGYHINQSLIAIGSGQIWGLGYGFSRQKFYFLPESYTDSIFAVLAEELGFVRVSAIIALFITFTLSGFLLARECKDPFGKLLVAGLISLIAFQSLINIGAISGLLPLTGITLPFFSYGGSSLAIIMTACGLILNIATTKQKI